MRILGISALYHDSAAALVEDGRIVAAAQEERFTRVKQDARFPSHAVRYCLAESGIDLSRVDHVVFYEKPLIKFERLLETYMGFAPKGFRSFQVAIPLWIKEKLFQKRLMVQELEKIEPDVDIRPRLLFAEHHMSHAASAFYASPFEDAAILTMDGVGEWATTTTGRGVGSEIELDREIKFPHSLGLFYSAFTAHIGFKVNSGEYKLMGLAPYGRPLHVQKILDHVIDVKPDGSFRLNMDYFEYATGLRMASNRFTDLFGPARDPEGVMSQEHMDVAASVQAVTDEVVLRLGRSLAASVPSRDLCMAGGVALNCVSNGKLLRTGVFDRIWIQPAAGDAGGAVGAALAAYHQHLQQPRSPSTDRDAMSGSFLGPAFTQTEAQERLRALDARFEVLDPPTTIGRTADALAQGRAVGWFQGRMEFGPRALGARSILADPRSPEMQSLLNLKIKFRESFRPFAPAVLEERCADWFELDVESPYMLLVADIASARRIEDGASEGVAGFDLLNVPRSSIPAVTHVDGSARVQTVHRDTNPAFHDLLAAFEVRTGCPVLVNTSFNVRGEPIVCTPEDAFRCFMGTDLDVLVVEGCFLEKAAETAARTEHGARFALD